MKQYLIKEIFGPTIQGEGSQAGKVVNFLRFAGCNRWTGKEEDRFKPQTVCTFCDTNFINGSKMSIQDILGQLAALNSNAMHLVISGGEPLLQLDLPLVLALKEAGYQLHIETNGSKPLMEMAPHFFHITMSPKQGPSETKLEWCHDLKLLYPYIKPEISLDSFSSFPRKTTYLQPVWGSKLEDVTDYLYSLKDVHLSIQTHKILGVQ